jgi:glutaminyl-peptide cyclotransferase
MKYFFPLFVFFAFYSCRHQTTKNQTKSQYIETPSKSSVSIVNTDNKAIQIGQDIKLSFQIVGNVEYDSIVAKIDYKPVLFKLQDKDLIISSINQVPGKRKISIVAFKAGNDIASGEIVITFLSDIVPEKYTYKVIRKLPHNTQWYTQGFEFSDGYLYEGTGMNGQSGLYKVDINKNDVLQSVTLPDDVFGEGITILNDKVYQLTWRSMVGFVYDKNTLQKLFDFSYPTEGWGLTNNGKELIMSDGTEKIYFLDTEFLQESHHIEVYDNSGAVDNLNELELIDGKLYANIYQTNTIVVIDINTGKVLQSIDMTGLLDKDKINSRVDVLNGIAFDTKTRKYYVTGKWWPFIFEVEWVKK